MNPRNSKLLLGMATLIFILPSVPRALPQTSPVKRYELFRTHQASKKRTATVVAREVRHHGDIEQVFYSRTQLGKELFRVSIGDYDSQGAIRCLYCGILDEIDLNSDGKPDYSWVGAWNDTNDAQILFLSSNSGYHGIDILKTVEDAWVRRFHTDAPEFMELAPDYFIARVVFENSSAGRLLAVSLQKNGVAPDKDPNIIRFRIPESQFKPYILPHP
jgi:hypothetical protein